MKLRSGGLLVLLLFAPVPVIAQAPDTLTYEGALEAALHTVTIAEFNPNRAQRDSMFAQAMMHARRALALNPDDAESHYAVARTVGRYAITRGIRERARLGTEIRDEALKAVAIKPDHDGALHILGLWNQKVMELSGVERLIARTLLGAKALGEASWEQAQRYLEEAVRVAPNSVLHRLDLGRLYAKRKQWQSAREQLESALSAPSTDYNDDNYKREAERALKDLP
jgi:tetratricopeptide (TPR) repeat protein